MSAPVSAVDPRLCLVHGLTKIERRSSLTASGGTSAALLKWWECPYCLAISHGLAAPFGAIDEQVGKALEENAKLKDGSARLREEIATRAPSAVRGGSLCQSVRALLDERDRLVRGINTALETVVRIVAQHDTHVSHLRETLLHAKTVILQSEDAPYREEMIAEIDNALWWQP